VVRSAGAAFAVEELRRPVPGPGEVLVKIVACGVCHTDLHVQDGSLTFRFPATLGHEVSGTVEEVGDGVEHVVPGDPVVGAFIMPCGRCRMCTAEREEICETFLAVNRRNGTLYDGTTRLYDADGDPVWMYSMGGLAEYAVLPALAVAPLPTGVPLAECAILGCAFLTAYGALVHVGGLGRGASVVVLGAGGVGLSTIATAKALGAGSVIAVDLTPERLAAAVELGATATVNASDGDPVAATLELTGGGADIVVEAVGHPLTVHQATGMTGAGGRCVLVGIAPSGVTAEFEITQLVRRKVQVLGSMGGRPLPDLTDLGTLVAEGSLDPGALITRRFSLEEAGTAYRLLGEGQILGRALIEMGR
jgi:S-(hydroxymethyl)glutathione dehydrogenase/alcohol dehydrogenase